MKVSVHSDPSNGGEFETTQSANAKKLSKKENRALEEPSKPTFSPKDKTKGKLVSSGSKKSGKSTAILDPIENPLFKGNWISKAFFLYINKIINAGCSKTFTEDMLYRLDKELLHDDFDNFYKFYEKKKEQYKDDFLGLLFDYNRK